MWVWARDEAEHCTLHGVAPHREGSVPNVTTAKSGEAGHTDVTGRGHLGGRGLFKITPFPVSLDPLYLPTELSTFYNNMPQIPVSYARPPLPASPNGMPHRREPCLSRWGPCTGWLNRWPEGGGASGAEATGSKVDSQGWARCFSKTEAIAMGKNDEWQSVLQKPPPLPRLCRDLDFGEHSEGKGLGVPGQVLGCRPEQEAHYHSPTASTGSSQLLSPSCSECHLV